MGWFIHEFLRETIRSGMEDPQERDRRFHEHIRRLAEAARLRRAEFASPTKPFGFWNSPENNAKYELNLDPGVNKLPGRAKQLDV